MIIIYLIQLWLWVYQSMNNKIAHFLCLARLLFIILCNDLTVTNPDNDYKTLQIYHK